MISTKQFHIRQMTCWRWVDHSIKTRLEFLAGTIGIQAIAYRDQDGISQERRQTSHWPWLAVRGRWAGHYDNSKFCSLTVLQAIRCPSLTRIRLVDKQTSPSNQSIPNCRRMREVTRNTKPLANSKARKPWFQVVTQALGEQQQFCSPWRAPIALSPTCQKKKRMPRRPRKW